MAKITSIKVPETGEVTVYLTFRKTSSGSVAVDVHSTGHGAHEMNGNPSNKVLKIDSAGRPWTEARRKNLEKAWAARKAQAKAAREGGVYKPRALGAKPEYTRKVVHAPRVCKCRALKPNSLINILRSRNETPTLIAEAVLGITGACMYQMMNSNPEKRRRIRPQMLKKLADHLGMVPSRISEPFTRAHRSHSY